MASKKLGNGDSEETLTPKEQKIAALNSFFGAELPWGKWTEAELDSFLTVVTDADTMTLKFYSASEDKIKLFREIGFRRAETGFKDRLNQMRTLITIADSMRPLKRLEDMSKMVQEEK